MPFSGPIVVIARGRRVACSGVSLSPRDVVVVPSASAGPGLQVQVEIDLAPYAARVRLAGVIGGEGQVRGKYAWSIVFTQVPADVGRALALYMSRAKALRETGRLVALGADASRPRKTSGSYSRIGTGTREAIRPASTGPAFPAVRTPASGSSGVQTGPHRCVHPPRPTPSPSPVAGLPKHVADALERARRRADGAREEDSRPSRPANRSAATPAELRQLYQQALIGLADDKK